MLPKTPNQRPDVETHGAERGLDRFEGFSDAVFAIALTLSSRSRSPDLPRARVATAIWRAPWPSSGANISRWFSATSCGNACLPAGTSVTLEQVRTIGGGATQE
jgi:hypothetical protein